MLYAKRHKQRQFTDIQSYKRSAWPGYQAAQQEREMRIFVPWTIANIGTKWRTLEQQ